MAGPLTNTGNLVGNVAAHAVVGGVGSVLGGGKFENGAITGAFSYLYSSAAQSAAQNRASEDSSSYACHGEGCGFTQLAMASGPEDLNKPVIFESGGSYGYGAGPGGPNPFQGLMQETLNGIGNFTSRFVLSSEQALDAALEFFSAGYRQIASGVFRSEDNLRQFRMGDGSLTGAHGTNGPHVHFETFGPAAHKPSVNNHVPLGDWRK